MIDMILPPKLIRPSRRLILGGLASVLFPGIARSALTINNLGGFSARQPESAPAGPPSVAFAGLHAVAGTGSTISCPVTSMTLGDRAGAVQTDDLLIAFNFWGSISNGAPGVTNGNGVTFTEIADLYASDTHDVNCSVSWGAVTGTPPTSITMAGPNSSSYGGIAAVLAFTGVDLTTPMDVTPTTATGINATSAVVPPITPVTEGASFLAIGAAAVPNGFGDQYSNSNVDYDGFLFNGTTGSSTDSRGISAHKLNLGSAGVEEDYGTFGMTASTSASWAAVMMALRPA